MNLRFLAALPLLTLAACGGNKEAQLREAFNTTPILYTAEATAKVFVEDSDNPGSIKRHFGERTIIIPVKANVKAGIPISEIQTMKVDGKTLYVTLPDPVIEIESTQIDYSGIASSVTGLRDDFSEEEISSLAQQGRSKIEEKLPELGLVEMAVVQAEQTIRGIASQMGLDVVFDVPSYSPLELRNLIKD